MKLLRLPFYVGLVSMCMGASSSYTTVTDVYICKGPQSKRYHYTKDCRGLSRCSTDIYKIELAEARRLGRILCGFED